MNRLRQRLWQNVAWGRTDRVLLVGMRSLLWAIDPLAGVPEGGVTLLAESQDDRLRLEAQLALLEPERRPQVLCGGPEALDGLPQDQSFEWIGGRLGTLDLQQESASRLWASLSARCSTGARLRLLISRPEAGPASALLGSRQLSDGLPSRKKDSSQRDSPQQDSQALQSLLEDEARWLKELHTPDEALQTLGWQLEKQVWSETLELAGGVALEQRWLADGSAYRLAMQAIDQTTLESLRALMRQQAQQRLALPMQHQLLFGQFLGTKKSPGDAGAC